VALGRLSRISTKGVAERRGRSALTVTGIALGVAIFFGVSVSNATVDRAFTALLGSPGGVADVVVRPLASGSRIAGSAPTLPAGLVPATAKLAGVHSAEGLLETQVVAGRVGLTVDGWDMAKFQGTLSAGRLPRKGEDGIALDARESVVFHAQVGAVLDLRATGGAALAPVAVRVTGILKSGSPIPGAATAVAPIGLAELLRGDAGHPVVSEIAVELDSGVDIPNWIARHTGELGPGVALVGQSVLVNNVRGDSRIEEDGFSGVAAISLFVGGMLIELTLSTSVLERTRRYAVLRALGASRAQVLGLVLGEAMVLGVIGCVVGLGVGLGIGVGLVGVTSSLIGVHLAGIAIPGSAVALGVAVGLVMTLVGSLVPAWRAARAPVVAALREDVTRHQRSLRGAALGVGLLVVGCVLLPLSGGDAAVRTLASAAVLVGSVLVVPLLLGPVAFVVGAVTRRLSPGVGRVGVMHLVKERNRSAFTAALIMVVVALGVAMATGIGTIRQAQDRQIRDQLGADLRLFAAGFPPTLINQIKAIPGVAEATPLTFGNASPYLTRHPTLVIGLDIVDPATYFADAGFAWDVGSDGAAAAALGRGGRILLPDSTAADLGVHEGDQILVNTAAGPRPFTVAGLFTTIIRDPALVVSDADGSRILGPGHLPTEVDVFDRPGAQLTQVLGAAVALLRRTRTPYTTQLGAKDRAENYGYIGHVTRVYGAILGVALLIGGLGLANTLAMSVIERRREIGVMRALGTHRRGIGALVLVEAATLTGVAYVLGLPLGVLLGAFVSRQLGTSFGFTPHQAIPWATFPTLLAVGVLVVLGAAAVPAHRAASLDPVLAIRLE